MVVVYRTSWMSWLVGRALVSLKFISLVNLLAARALVPELLQSDCTPERIARAMAPLLTPTPEREAQIEGMRSLREELAPAHSPPAARRAAEEVLALLETP
jgi:lipid-A-disaccharide synthase